MRIGPPFCCSLNVWTRAWMSLLVSGFSGFDLARDVDQLALRLLARHAGREVAERLQRARVALLLLETVDLAERHPDVGVERKLEAFGHHADDRRRDCR